MHTYRAQLGTRSLQVDVDPQTGVVTLPPDTTLEDGHWILLGEGDEIWAFDVTEGVVGIAHLVFDPFLLKIVITYLLVGSEGIDEVGEQAKDEPARPSGLFAALRGLFDRIRERMWPGSVRRPTRRGVPTTLQRYEEHLFHVEQSISVVDQRPCPGCGCVHSLGYMTPESLPWFINHIKDEIEEVRRSPLHALFSSFLRGNENSLEGHHLNRAEVWHLVSRWKQVLAWKPPAPKSA